MRALRTVLRCGLLGLAATAVGCSSVDSSAIKTSGMDANFYAIADGTGATEARAVFNVHGSALTFVTLQSGDAVSATTGGQTQTLGEESLLGVTQYGAVFQGADAEGTAYAFALQRASDASAPGSSVTLPKVFSITSPVGSTLTYSRANDDLSVSYGEASTPDQMAYSLDGDCIQAVSTQPLTGDTGSFSIPKGTIVQLPQASTTTCAVKLTLWRIRTGTLDGAFAGGGAYGVQSRSFTFTSTP